MRRRTALACLALTVGISAAAQTDEIQVYTANSRSPASSR